MANTRDFKSLGVYAKDAQAVTPDTPRTVGTAYRNVSFSTLQQTEGKEFNVIPKSENLNQPLYNISRFTDYIDKQGFLGWKDDVTYNLGAVVVGSDGQLYQSLKEDLNGIDPIDESDPSDPTFWRILTGTEAIEFSLASQTKGSEGARQVGTYDKYKVPGGRTLQKSLQENATSLYQMHGMNIHAMFRGIVTDSITGRKSFNIDVGSSSITPSNYTNGAIGYITFSFIDPIPADAIYYGFCDPFTQVISYTQGNQTTVFRHAISNAYTNLTTTNITVGATCLMSAATYPGKPAGWPEYEDDASRDAWDVQFILYTIDGV